MKIYIAGIDLKNFKSDHRSKTQCIINFIEDIKNDAVASLGKDAIVVIVLHEYALTPHAIHNKEKKECLVQLEQAIKKTENVILIPGSLAAHEQFTASTNPEKKKRKIIDNYSKNLSNPHFTNDPIFNKDYQNAKAKFVTESVNQSIILQNSSYIISSDATAEKVKHKKSYPWNEDNKLVDKTNHFFYIGSGDDLINNVLINGKTLDVGLVICREHLISPSEKIINNPSTLEVIVSDSVKLHKENLFGAVNIHMDSVTGLNVHVNDMHPKSNIVKEIKSFCYSPELVNIPFNTTNKCLKVESTISHFSRDLNPKPVKHESKDFGFSFGFLNPPKPASTSVPKANPQKASKPATTNPPCTTVNKATSATHGCNEFGFKKGFLS